MKRKIRKVARPKNRRLAFQLFAEKGHGPIGASEITRIASLSGYSERQIRRFHTEFLGALDNPNVSKNRTQGAPKGHRLPDETVAYIKKRVRANRGRVAPLSERQLALDIEKKLKAEMLACPSLRTIQRVVSEMKFKGVAALSEDPDRGDWLALLTAYADVKNRQARRNREVARLTPGTTEDQSD